MHRGHNYCIWQSKCECKSRTALSNPYWDFLSFMVPNISRKVGLMAEETPVAKNPKNKTNTRRNTESQSSTSSTSSTTRVRDNQRRSRARRKEYIHELEQRLQKFERAGVKATQELQAAARQVAVENALLRSLLEELGVAGKGVENYLKSHRDTNTANTGPMQLQHPPKFSLSSSARLADHHSATHLPSTAAPSAQMEVSQPMHFWGLQTISTRTTTQSDHIVHQNRSSSSVCSLPKGINQCYRHTKNSLHEIGVGRVDSSLSDHPAVETHRDVINGQTLGAEQHVAPEPVISDAAEASGQDTGQYMPCEAAARIITTMRGDRAEQDVRSELGCHSPDSDCMVRNMDIFELLDKR
ncbi:hypothetical protein L228DRAFT_278924 [Xylona heveae TC161]|uniref:BZIP domain-containing protein n=1 Tax=Xylona heveae (strain CBS 132557 / TC161) TaxID=1328760 RepID=A0A165FCS1_XYLHT|nr:hypothetical protein L228DRAFT_278924 [Xylona heveae TC161]KZF20830.1 hypothetical protein L228DRAFT_278924 [Xylona heveae TC161]